MKQQGVMVDWSRMSGRLLTGLVVALILALGYQALPVAAQQATNAANTLKVSPVRTDIEVNPGESKVVQTTITNLTDKAIMVHPIENDFVAGDERGTPALILDENMFAPTHSLKRFMSPLSDVVIPAKQSKTVKVTITVPSDAQAGGYFGAVRFAPTSPEDGGQVNLSASVASLILLRVPGDTVEKIDLTDFSVQQKGKTGSFFLNGNDLQVTARFQNAGNVQVAPFGKISVKKGSEVVYATDFNATDPRDVILPDSARRWDVALKEADSFGHYTVLATLSYGTNNQTIEVSKSFWVVPPAILIAGGIGLLVLIALIAGGIWMIVRRRRRPSFRNYGPRR